MNPECKPCSSVVVVVVGSSCDNRGLVRAIRGNPSFGGWPCFCGTRLLRARFRFGRSLFVLFFVRYPAVYHLQFGTVLPVPVRTVLPTGKCTGTNTYVYTYSTGSLALSPSRVVF